ncbi:MAG: ATP-binding cassette domain-containing protein [Candidatus Zixiibacteriota bacterium]
MISLKAVSKSFDGGHDYAVRNVNLFVGRGELVALVGESGSGKTTTLKVINRLIEPSGGRILIEDQDISLSDPVRLRRSIGYVFQGIGLFPHLTVAENIAVTLNLLGWNKADIDFRVSELLELLRLSVDEYKLRMPAELSGGQRQRVGVARALAAQPSLMLMDEPFGALDPITRAELQEELKSIHRTLSVTIVLVTHDISEALYLADRIAVMESGRIVGLGTPEELLKNPGHAYVERLLDAPRRHMRDYLQKSGGDGGGIRQ